MSNISKIKVGTTEYNVKDNISGYVTGSVNNLTNYYTKTYIDDTLEDLQEEIEAEIPTKTSELTNDSGFATTAQLGGKQDTLVSGVNIKTINNTSLLGSGNIDISSISGTMNYNELNNKPQIAGVTLTGNKTLSDLGIVIPTKTSDLTNDSNFATTSAIPTKTSDLTNDSSFVTSSVLSGYALLTESGNSIVFSMDTSDYILTALLKDKNGNTISTATTNLPIEADVVNGRYDTNSQSIVLTKRDGTTITFSLASLIAGTQPLINSTNKLASDLINTTNQTNQFVLASDKVNWNAKQNAISAGTGITLSGSQISVTDYNSILASIASKQTTLVSGTNIKTINNVSILGSGNIDIQGGSGTSNYNSLSNKPQINGVELSGNKTTAQLNLFSGNYSDLTNKPTIPTKTSDLTNDSSFVGQTVYEDESYNSASFEVHKGLVYVKTGNVVNLYGEAEKIAGSAAANFTRVPAGWYPARSYYYQYTEVAIPGGETYSSNPVSIDDWGYLWIKVSSSLPWPATGIFDGFSYVISPYSAEEEGGLACFAGDTPIYSPENKTIAELQIGDEVYSYNHEEDHYELDEVKNIRTHEEITKIVEITLEDETIICTPEHKIFCIERPYDSASSLQTGYHIFNADQELVEIQDIEIKEIESITGYDIDTKNHNYFVGDNHLLVRTERITSNE